jgi:hypothetical protein
MSDGSLANAFTIGALGRIRGRADVVLGRDYPRPDLGQSHDRSVPVSVSLH